MDGRVGSFCGGLGRRGGVDGELLDADGSGMHGMQGKQFFVGFPAVVRVMAFRFVGRKVLIARVTVFVIIFGRRTT